MRAVVQRVTDARVRVDGRIVGEIGHGLLVLLGVGKDDREEDAKYLAGKIATLRLFKGDAGKDIDRSVLDVGGSVLVVSQFTLYGDAEKGRRPSFITAARPDLAERLYEQFASMLAERGLRVERGEFGAMMDVELVNDGPVTLWLER